VLRITGTADDAGTSLPWSVILKHFHPPFDPASPRLVDLHAYSSGLVADLPGAIRAARCYGVDRSARRC
jgi:hypothetical protein